MWVEVRFFEEESATGDYNTESIGLATRAIIAAWTQIDDFESSVQVWRRARESDNARSVVSWLMKNGLSDYLEIAYLLS